MYKKLLPYAFAVFSIAYFAAFYFNQPTLNGWLKLVPVALLIGAMQWQQRQQKYIALGLIFSLLGDYLLSPLVDIFVAGLGAFLIAHVFYILAFVHNSRKPMWHIAIIMYAIGGGIFWVFSDGVGQLAIPVAVYILVIQTMVWRAIAQAQSHPRAMLAAIGAVLFAASDSMIGFNKFVLPFDESRYLIMVCYWAAQWFIFSSSVIPNTKSE